MTTSKTIQLEPTGTKPIELKLVEVDGKIQLVDCFIGGEWQGSKRTIKLWRNHLIRKGLIKDEQAV